MPYTKQNFIDGQKLRAYQLNHMEDGIEAGSNSFVALEQTAASAEDGGENIITATRADGSTNTIVIRNGSKGSRGETGPRGPQGDPGASSWNDLTDKPFGEVKVPQFAFAHTINAEVVGDYIRDTNLPEYGTLGVVIEPGEEYRVTYDGQVYYCTAYNRSNNANFPTLGNALLAGAASAEGNGEPFYISKLTRYLVCYTDTVGQHTIAVEKMVDGIKLIDPKYLPMADIIAAVQAAMESTEESTT